MRVINATNVRDALPTAVYTLMTQGKEEPTREGLALVYPTPVTIRYTNPKQHVLRSPVRDANPFFHLMEAMWMLAGRDDSAFLDNYIKGFSQRYGKDGVVLDAYGHRWRYGYPYDQLDEIVSQLRKEPTTRQAVLQLWGAGRDDLRAYSSKPCNLMVAFRIRDSRLDMTVYNRSNDLIWGCCGANAVHFPILQEYMAGKLACPVGEYWQVTANLHLYDSHVKLLYSRTKEQTADTLANSLEDTTPYPQIMPLMDQPQYFDEELEELMELLDEIHEGNTDVYDGNFSNRFFCDVVLKMAIAHSLFKKGEKVSALEIVELVMAEDWKQAGKEWMDRRNGVR